MLEIVQEFVLVFNRYTSLEVEYEKVCMVGFVVFCCWMWFDGFFVESGWTVADDLGNARNSRIAGFSRSATGGADWAGKFTHATILAGASTSTTADISRTVSCRSHTRGLSQVHVRWQYQQHWCNQMA